MEAAIKIRIMRTCPCQLRCMQFCSL